MQCKSSTFKVLPDLIFQEFLTPVSVLFLKLQFADLLSPTPLNVHVLLPHGRILSQPRIRVSKPSGHAAGFIYLFQLSPEGPAAEAKGRLASPLYSTMRSLLCINLCTCALEIMTSTVHTTANNFSQILINSD